LVFSLGPKGSFFLPKRGYMAYEYSGVTRITDDVEQKVAGLSEKLGAVRLQTETCNIADTGFKQTKVTVLATSGVLLTALANRRTISIFNNSPNMVVYIGDSSVSVASGYPIGAKSSIQIALGPNVNVYAISTASVDVRILEVS
jgi:hypothetical protein